MGNERIADEAAGNEAGIELLSTPSDRCLPRTPIPPPCLSLNCAMACSEEKPKQSQHNDNKQNPLFSWLALLDGGRLSRHYEMSPARGSVEKQECGIRDPRLDEIPP